MSQENVEMVQRLAEAINLGVWPPRDLLTADVEVVNATTAVTDATYIGYEGADQWRRDIFDVVDDARYVIDEVLATGPDYVVITNRVVGRGSSSGVPVELPWSSVFWFRDGRIARAVGYTRRREALAAVGLSE